MTIFYAQEKFIWTRWRIHGPILISFLIVAVLNGLNCTGDLVANIGLMLSFLFKT